MVSESRALPSQAYVPLLDRSLLVDAAVIAAVWCLSILIVNPIGEFPLIDDWSYRETLRRLLETGEYRPLGWAVMTLLSHILWGAVFALADDLSFNTLRISSLVAGFIGLLGTYVLMRDLRQPRMLAVVAALTLAFYPPYYVLSYMYMTDVPFAAMAVWSVVLLARSLRSGSNIELLAGTALALAAVLSRQVGLFISLAFAATVLLKPGLSWRTAMRGMIPAIICITALLTFNYWLEVTGRTGVHYGQVNGWAWRNLNSEFMTVRILSSYFYFTPIYFGLFLLPILLLGAQVLFLSDEMKKRWRSHRKVMMVVVSVTVVVMAVSATVLATRMGIIPLIPFADQWGNQLNPKGLGLRMIHDLIDLKLDHHVALLPIWFWTVLTATGLLGALLLIAKLSVHASELLPKVLRRYPIDDDQTVGMFLVLCTLVYLLPFLAFGFYDRYLIPLIPILAAGLISLSGKQVALTDGSSKALRRGAVIVLAIWAMISIGGTRDYMTWNRVRWQALHELMQDRNVPPEEINGGHEFNGLYLYDNYPERLATQEAAWRSWVVRDTYQIGFGPVPGYTIIKEYPYWHWFPPHTQRIVVMQKTHATPPAEATSSSDR